MESKSIIILDIQFFADIKIIMETVIVLIDDAKATIGRGDFQRIHQMPLGASKIVGFPVKDDTVGNEVEGIIATTNALVAWLQQVLVLVNHAQTEGAVHRDDKLGELHRTVILYF